MSIRFSIVALVAVCCLSHAVGKEVVGVSKTKPAKGRYVQIADGYMTSYEQTIPGTAVKFTMTPVPGGEVKLGLRKPVEGQEPGDFSPAVTVKLPPYWIGMREVSWAEYWRFTALNQSFGEISYIRGALFEGDRKLEAELKKHKLLRRAIDAKPSHVDGVTAPTPLYDPEFTYTSGQEGKLPAVSMTVYAGKQYTKWLSTITGDDYRLPSEAEWEYAARAGAKGDPMGGKDVDAVAWYDDNSDYKSQKVGAKRANEWGLFDTAGNVAEWVLDAPSDRKVSAQSPLSWRDAVTLPEKMWPRIAKGGFYESASDEFLFAARLRSQDEDWKSSDPNSPKSPWWFADDPACGIGMRLVRPLKPMDKPTKRLAWEIDTPDLAADVAARVEEGRGKLQAIDKSLPQALKQLESPGMRKQLE